MIGRLHYKGGKTEDHPLKNGVELADYIRRVDVPGSVFAFNLRGRHRIRSGTEWHNPWHAVCRPARRRP